MNQPINESTVRRQESAASPTGATRSRGLASRMPAEASISTPDLFGVKVRPMWTALRQEPLFFWFFCGVIFLEYVRPHDIYPWLQVFRLGVVFLLGAFVLRLLSPERAIRTTRAMLATVFLGLVTLLSAIAAYYPSESFRSIDIVINWVILVWLFVNVVTTRFRFFIVVLLLLLASFKMAQHGTITWLSRGLAYANWGVAGPGGWFGNAADLGLQMAIFIPLSVAFILGCREYWGRVKRGFFWLLPVCGLATALATNQRGTLLAVISVGLSAIAVSRKRFRALLLLAVVGVASFWLMPEEYKQRMMMAGSEQDETSASRLRYWEAGLETYAENPVIGIGYRNWQQYMWEHRPGLSLRSNVQEVAHSVPITILAELGTVGFIAYYTLVVLAIVYNRRSYLRFRGSSEKLWAHMAVALNLGMVAYLVAGTFISVAWYPFLFVQLGLSAALYGLSSHLSPEDSGARKAAAVSPARKPHYSA